MNFFSLLASISIVSSLFLQTYCYATPKKVVVNIFVHGTHGSLLSSLSLPNVFHGKTAGTLYEHAQHHWRKNSWSYYNGLMGKPGLIEIDLDSDNRECHSMAKPLLQAYDYLWRQMVDNPGEARYLLLGWNGKLSQHDRFTEALHSYALVSDYITLLQQQGYQVVTRVFTHSHGANKILWWGGIAACLNGWLPREAKQLDYLKRFAPLIKKARIEKCLSETFRVDELIMLAAPIQEETKWLCWMPFFGKVWHVYSDNDTMQVADFISTHARKSFRRLDLHADRPMLDESISLADVRQIKIMVDRTMGVTGYRLSEVTRLRALSLVRGGNALGHFPTDPSHADFWFVNWHNKTSSLGYVPVVCLVPLIAAAAEQSCCVDSDVNLFTTDREFICQCYSHDDHYKACSSILLPRTLFDQINKFITAGHFVV